MHQIHAKNGTCPKFKGQNSRRTVSPNLAFIQSDSIRLVVAAANIAPLVLEWRPEFLGVIPKPLRTPTFALRNDKM